MLSTTAYKFIVGFGQEHKPNLELYPLRIYEQLYLVVKDIRQICQQLQERGVVVSDVTEYPQGIKYAYFSDPDGNEWVLQELPPK